MKCQVDINKELLLQDESLRFFILIYICKLLLMKYLILNKNKYCYIEIVFMVILSKLLNKGFEKNILMNLLMLLFII